MYIKNSLGVWVDAAPKIFTNGEWRNVDDAYIFTNGKWQLVDNLSVFNYYTRQYAYYYNTLEEKQRLVYVKTAGDDYYGFEVTFFYNKDTRGEVSVLIYASNPKFQYEYGMENLYEYFQRGLVKVKFQLNPIYKKPAVFIDKTFTLDDAYPTFSSNYEFYLCVKLGDWITADEIDEIWNASGDAYKDALGTLKIKWPRGRADKPNEPPG